jgi:uncharacterized protein (DUF2267 family)
VSRTGLEVFDQTLHCTNIWIDDLADDLGCSRRAAWHALGAVLWSLRDRLPLKLTAELAAGMPLLVRGAYFHRWEPLPRNRHDTDFLEDVAENLGNSMVAPMDAVAIVFDLLDQKLESDLVLKVRRALSADARALWPEPLSDRSREGGEPRPRKRDRSRSGAPEQS